MPENRQSDLQRTSPPNLNINTTQSPIIIFPNEETEDQFLISLLNVIEDQTDKQPNLNYLNGQFGISQSNRMNVGSTQKFINNNDYLLPAIKDCGTVPSNRIIGGNSTELDDFPWMALIQYTKRMYIFIEIT